MTNFIRSLCITICTALFNFIPTLYKLFYDLASNHELFSSETIDTFSRNIYVLVSVVMLFAFAVKAIESIINPDMLLDSKKGFVSVIKRSVIALVLIVAIPFGFDLFYKFQDEVMGKSLIEKVIIGVAINEDGNGSENLAEKSGAANMLSSTALSSVLYPAAKDTCVEYEDSDVCTKYNDAIEDISKLYKLIPDINEKVEGEDGEEEYALTYEGFGLLSILVGVVLIYMLVLFCIDTALRLVKMAFLEITAPVSVVAYIFGGNDILKNWFKEVSSTALSLFGRVAALALMIFVLSVLPEFVDNSFEGLEGKIINLLIIMATLMFVKEAPNMIEKIFGIKIGGKGGISGRLGSMAGVGNIAKSAWEKLGSAGKALGTLGAIGTAGALGYAAAGVGKTLGHGAQMIDNKALGGKGQQFASAVKGKANEVKSSNVGQQIGRLGRAASAGIKAGGTTAAIKAANQAFKDDKLTKYKKDEKQSTKDEAFMDKLGVDADSKTLKDTSKNPVKARNAFANLKDDISSNKMLTSKQAERLSGKIDADLDKSNLEKLQSNHTKVKDELKSLASDAAAMGDSSLNNELTKLMNQFSRGEISTSDLAQSLNYMAFSRKIDSSSAKSIVSNLDNIDHLVSNDVPGGVISSLVENGKVSGGALAGAIDAATNRAASADAVLKREIENSNDKTKHEIENYTQAAETINKEYTKEINKQGSKTSDSSQIQGPLPATNSSGSSTQPNQGANANTSNNTNSSQTTQTNNQSSSNSSNNDSNNTNTGYNPYNNSNAGTNNGSGSQQAQDLSGFFDGLSKDIRDANAATNSILNDQLKTQRSALDESRKQNSTLDNISSGVNNINSTVNQMNNNIKDFSNDTSKNLKDIGQKLNDNNRKNNE